MRTWSRRARALNHQSKLGPTIPMPFSTRPAPPASQRASSAIALASFCWRISCRPTGVSVEMTWAFWSCRCATRTLSISRTYLPPAAQLPASTTGKLRTRPSAEDARRRQIHLHLAGADALHHDARIARIREARAQCRECHQTPHLLRGGPPGHQAGADGILQEVSAL